MSRQAELFTREEAPRAAPVRRYRAIPKKAAKPLAWEGMGAWVRHIGRLLAVETCSSDHFSRFHATARTLTVEKIRACSFAEDLQRVERLLVDHARGAHAYLHGLDRVWLRAERGELLVETRNRIVQLQLGRVTPREKGPRLDPALMPTPALERLIQSHADMAVVEQMRAERARRLLAAPSRGEAA